MDDEAPHRTANQNVQLVISDIFYWAEWASLVAYYYTYSDLCLKLNTITMYKLNKYVVTCMPLTFLSWHHASNKIKIKYIFLFEWNTFVITRCAYYIHLLLQGVHTIHLLLQGVHTIHLLLQGVHTIYICYYKVCILYTFVITRCADYTFVITRYIIDVETMDFKSTIWYLTRIIIYLVNN